jgi:hypothetical protein
LILEFYSFVNKRTISVSFPFSDRTFCRFELKTLLMCYRHQVEFIQGTPVKDSDLDRVSAKVASAFYLLADQEAKVAC